MVTIYVSKEGGLFTAVRRRSSQLPSNSRNSLAEAVGLLVCERPEDFGLKIKEVPDAVAEHKGFIGSHLICP